MRMVKVVGIRLLKRENGRLEGCRAAYVPYRLRFFIFYCPIPIKSGWFYETIQNNMFLRME